MGTNYCSHCGTAPRPEWRFCRRCGTVSVAADGGDASCPECTEEIAHTWRYCCNCGTDLTPSAGHVPETSLADATTGDVEDDSPGDPLTVGSMTPDKREQPTGDHVMELMDVATIGEGRGVALFTSPADELKDREPTNQAEAPLVSEEPRSNFETVDDRAAAPRLDRPNMVSGLHPPSPPAAGNPNVANMLAPPAPPSPIGDSEAAHGPDPAVSNGESMTADDLIAQALLTNSDPTTNTEANQNSTNTPPDTTIQETKTTPPTKTATAVESAPGASWDQDASRTIQPPIGRPYLIDTHGPGDDIQSEVFSPTEPRTARTRTDPLPEPLAHAKNEEASEVATDEPATTTGEHTGVQSAELPTDRLGRTASSRVTEEAATRSAPEAASQSAVRDIAHFDPNSFRNLGPLGQSAQLLLIFGAATGSAAMLALLVINRRLGQFAETGTGSSGVASVESLFNTRIRPLLIAILVLEFLLVAIYANRANRNVELLGGSSLRTAPILLWGVPLLNMFYLKQRLDRGLRGRGDLQSKVRWSKKSLGSRWTMLYLASALFGTGLIVWGWLSGGATIEQAIDSNAYSFFGHFCLAAAALALVKAIDSVSDLQHTEASIAAH